MGARLNLPAGGAPLLVTWCLRYLSVNRALAPSVVGPWGCLGSPTVVPAQQLYVA